MRMIDSHRFGMNRIDMHRCGFLIRGIVESLVDSIVDSILFIRFSSTTQGVTRLRGALCVSVGSHCVQRGRR